MFVVRLPVCLLVSALILGAGLARADTVDTVEWTKTGSWDVSFYPTSRGCQAYALFDQKTAFFIGFDNNLDLLSLDITLLDQSWQQIEDGKDYEIELRFGDQGPWRLQMSGVRMDGYPGLHAMIAAESVESDMLIEEFRRETRMVWRFGDTLLGRYALDGSRKAFDEVVACQRARFETTETAGTPNEPVEAATE